MASNTRQQLERWLKTIEVNGSVIDIGGVFMPICGRTKTWNVDEYKIFDIKPARKGIVADFVWDLNDPLLSWPYHFLSHFDVAFAIEVLSHVYDPVSAIRNIYYVLKDDGLLYLSVHTIFPQHTGGDSLRYTLEGVHKILKAVGFEIVRVKPKMAVDTVALGNVMKHESKVYHYPGEIGYLIEARKK